MHATFLHVCYYYDAELADFFVPVVYSTAATVLGAHLFTGEVPTAQNSQCFYLFHAMYVN